MSSLFGEVLKMWSVKLRNRRFSSRAFSSNLIEYYFYFILISILIIITLGLSLYLFFASTMKSEAIQSNRNILVQIRNSHEAVLSEVDRYFANIVLDPAVSSFMRSFDKTDVLMIQNIDFKLQNIKNSNDYIDSIYLYSFDCLYALSTTQGVAKLELFYDNYFVKSIAIQALRKNTVYTRSIKNYPSTEEISVLSFTKPIPLNFIGSPNAVVVINIKGSYLNRMIESINIKEGSNIIVADEDGNMISKKGNFVISSELTDKKYLANYKNLGDGFFIEKINGRNTLISYLYSDKYKWFYIYVVPMSNVTYSLVFLGRITFFLCVLLVLLSLIGSFFFSKKIFSPIGKIVEMLKTGEDREIFTKETVLIRKNLESLIKRYKSLKELMGEYRIYQKNKFLKDIVDGSSNSFENISERLAYYEIDLNLEGYFEVYAISIDNYQKFNREYTEQQKNMHFIYINECISRILKEHCNFIVETNPNEMVVLLNLSSKMDGSEIKILIEDIAEKLHAAIGENLRYTFTFGASSLNIGIENIHKSYYEAVTALKYKVLMGGNRIIFFDSISQGARSIGMYPYSIEKDILNNFSMGNKEEVMAALERFGTYICNNLTDDIELIRHFYLQLLTASVKKSYELDWSLGTISLAQKDIYAELLKEETMDGMISYLKSVYESVLNVQRDIKGAKNRELVKSAVKYIEANYGKDLNIEMLAEQFYISPSHLRKIFKDETMTTIKGFIDDIRMKKAKEMLEDANIKISEIAKKVGYFTVQSFTKAFRLGTGMTPGDYRMKSLKK